MHPLLWSIFIGIIALALFVDLGLNSRHPEQAMSLRSATGWTLFWVALGLFFGGVIWAAAGPQRAMEYLTGYLIEESLSVDNMFVFVMIFNYFTIPAAYQHRVLKWGILGAIVMRFILIFTGVALLQKFHWIMYLFGALLIYTAVKMFTDNPEEMDPGDNGALKLLKRWIPITTSLEHNHFFTRVSGVLHATPLFAALIVVEVSDLIFAMDSIPAVLAVSRDPFIVFSSNVFAILGLRALFFVISGVMHLFRFLRYGLGIVLAFIGLKMVAIDYVHIPIVWSLGVVLGVLSLSVLLSVFIPEKQQSVRS